jgi:hypothetical protein
MGIAHRPQGDHSSDSSIGNSFESTGGFIVHDRSRLRSPKFAHGAIVDLQSDEHLSLLVVLPGISGTVVTVAEDLAALATLAISPQAPERGSWPTSVVRRPLRIGVPPMASTLDESTGTAPAPRVTQLSRESFNTS